LAIPKYLSGSSLDVFVDALAMRIASFDKWAISFRNGCSAA
jgi:hypothetical protein